MLSPLCLPVSKFVLHCISQPKTGHEKCMQMCLFDWNWKLKKCWINTQLIRSKVNLLLLPRSVLLEWDETLTEAAKWIWWKLEFINIKYIDSGCHSSWEQRQWSQPKPDAQTCRTEKVPSQQKTVFFFPFLLTTELEIKTEWDQWRHTTWGQANTCTSIRGWWVGGGILCHWVSLSRGSVLPQEMEREAW